jgi:ABC-type Fe3+ transport system permease subunit
LGDFSVAAIVSPGPQTLPLYVQSLMGQYRLEMAAAAALILLLAGVVFSLTWEVLSNGKN